MAVISFNFSRVYKDNLLNGKKRATIVTGNKTIGINEEVLVFIQKGESLFEKNTIVQKMGIARIIKEVSKSVKLLTYDEAIKCGYETLEELKEGLNRWYNTDDNSIITFIEFDLKLDDE